jgi:Ser/Thr protein kinase RdoA (MazF antagonist)
LLPTRWVSRALRVAMSESDWLRFEAAAQVLGGGESTQARVYGRALSHLLDAAATAPAEPGPLDWLDWERRKASRLLHRGNGADGRASA